MVEYADGPPPGGWRGLRNFTIDGEALRLAQKRSKAAGGAIARVKPLVEAREHYAAIEVAGFGWEVEKAGYGGIGGIPDAYEIIPDETDRQSDEVHHFDPTYLALLPTVAEAAHAESARLQCCGRKEALLVTFDECNLGARWIALVMPRCWE